jgi:hypothetical protein
MMRSFAAGPNRCQHHYDAAICRHRALPYLLAGLIAAGSLLPACAQAQFFQLFASVGTATANSDVPVGRENKVIKEIGRFPIETFAGALFGVLEYRTDGNWDPYIAVRAEVTNVTDSPQRVGFSLFMPVEPVPTPATPPLPTFTGLLTIELKDRNGNGSASYTGGGAGFGLTDAFLGRVFGTPLTPTHSITMAAPEKQVVYDITSQPLPASLSGQWSGMELLHFAIFPTVSSLSPGDSVEFYAFGCITVPGSSCPTPPELALAVPEPQSYMLLLAGLAVVLRAVHRKNRTRTS